MFLCDMSRAWMEIGADLFLRHVCLLPLLVLHLEQDKGAGNEHYNKVIVQMGACYC